VRSAQKRGKSLQSSPVSTGGVAAAIKKNVIDKSRLIQDTLKRRQDAPDGAKSLTVPNSFVRKKQRLHSSQGIIPEGQRF
jgi:hypothetical protein